MRPLVFQVQGMSCASCALRVERVLKRLAGVQDVRIDIQTGKTELFCLQVPSFEEVQRTIQKSGYRLRLWQEPREVRPARGQSTVPAEVPPWEPATVKLKDLLSFEPGPRCMSPRSPVSPVSEAGRTQSVVFQVQGMHCASCVLTIERGLRQLPGVQDVRVNARTGKTELLCVQVPPFQVVQSTIQRDGYTMRPWQEQGEAGGGTGQPGGTRSVVDFGITLLLLSGLSWLLSHLSFLPQGAGLSANMSYGVIFALGLVASVSTCMASAGGLLLGLTARGRAKQGSVASRRASIQVGLVFNLGRLLSYTLFGTLIGALGSVFTLSSQINGVVMILASAIMLLLGAQLLQLAPWLRALQPRLPRSLARMLDDASGTPSKPVSFLLGAATFFLPCGFTQALQIYVLSRGNAAAGALTMLAFALGTLPALLSFSAISSFFTGTVQRYVAKVSGALVLVFGLMSMQSGLTLAGVSLPSVTITWPNQQTAQAGPMAPVVAGKQVVSMKVIGLSYVPSTFTVMQGMPVSWRVDGSQAQGCAQVLTLPALGINAVLPARGSTTITFVPRNTGTLRFHCPLAMTTANASFLVVPPMHMPAR